MARINRCDDDRVAAEAKIGPAVAELVKNPIAVAAGR